MSHELDAATELDGGDPADLAERYRQLRDRHPHLRVLGGCCGTNHHHIDAIAAACVTECGHDRRPPADAPRRRSGHRLRRGAAARTPARWSSSTACRPTAPAGPCHRAHQPLAQLRPRLPGPRTIGPHPGRYRLDDYVDDADRLLHMIGQPAVVVGHSLGAIVAAALAQDRHPLVAAVFLEDLPLYVVEPGVFAGSGLARGFAAARPHRTACAERAPVETYRDLLAASPHPAGDHLGDHLHDDARSRAGGSPGPTLRPSPPCSTGPRSPPTTPTARCAALVVRADPAYDAAFRPDDEHRLHRTSPHVEVVAMPGAGHNIRGDRATRRPLPRRAHRLPHPPTGHDPGAPTDDHPPHPSPNTS